MHIRTRGYCICGHTQQALTQINEAELDFGFVFKRCFVPLFLGISWHFVLHSSLFLAFLVDLCKSFFGLLQVSFPFLQCRSMLARLSSLYCMLFSLHFFASYFCDVLSLSHGFFDLMIFRIPFDVFCVPFLVLRVCLSFQGS